MQISQKTWNRYRNRLAAIDKKAAEEMEAYLQRIGGYENHVEEVIKYAYALSSRYGEAAAAAACEMYDAVAEASGVNVPPAEPAATPEYKEVARAVNGTVKNSSEKQIPRTVGRLVKRTGADTTLKNAGRDGAQFAWIPMGDTCAFCLTLASRGWQHMSKNALKNGHAEHIHANCDCQYAIRFDDNTSIEGYDPDKYREMYDNAEGDSPQEKINSLRRMLRRKQHRARGFDVLKEYVDDATPGRGFINYEKGFDPEKRPDEVKVAKLIFDRFGGEVLLKAEKDGQKNPDYEWMGSLWDLKTTSSEKAANSAIKSGMKQIKTNPGGIVLDFKNTDFSMEELMEVIDLRMQWYPKDSADIMVISNDKIIKILRY